MKYMPVRELQMPQKIAAGPDSIEKISDFVMSEKIKKVTIITDEGVWRTGITDRPGKLLKKNGIHADLVHDVPAEPAVDQIKRIFNLIKEFKPQMLIGIGGGSVIDTVKILAVMLTNDTALEDLLGAEKIQNKGIPTLAIPTTAGTGSEVTPNAIVLVPESACKQGIISRKIIPDFVILDPIMTTGLPPFLTAATGMDAFCHAIECYISLKANPLSDSFAVRAVNLIWKSIRKVYHDGSDMNARFDMLLGSFLAGWALCTSGGTAVHAMSYPVGGKFRVPHGVSNAIILPHLMKFNMYSVERRLASLAAGMELYGNATSERQRAEQMVEDIHLLVR
ncbi:MAG: iron-containing alcohol dehydrogenase [Victivallaceae bacterium]|nr:iron-containing alcohol dehydrogenase [Victivallaceae bacterium]